ncbi:hypothetical protein FACS189431_4910 [Alphaproteobacteria bacterium]|nr:hypothetical protein FACS189431_4910 [Alphaproteobacteria bacterium]
MTGAFVLLAVPVIGYVAWQNNNDAEAAPTVDSIGPNTGSTAGGTDVTITGAGFLPPAPTTMQDPNLASYCANNMSVYPDAANGPNTLTLTDTRNNQDYMVRKLADGNCWMINNLKLAPNTTLTSTDTDLNTIATFDFGGHNSLISDGSTVDYDTPNVYGPLSSTNSSNGEDYDTSDPTSDHFGGYLYNWSAATAGESQTSMPGDGTNNDIAPNSICPKNWRLPKGGDYGAFDPNDEFDQLNAKMAGYSNNQDVTYQGLYNRLYSNWQFDGAFRGVFAGNWNYGIGIYGQGDYSNFWSSSANPGDPYSAFYAHFDSLLIIPSAYADRYLGSSLRCLSPASAPTPTTPPVVTFDGVPATNVTIVNDTTITATTPAHATPGAVDVVVDGPDGLATMTNGFTYVAPPVVTSITPNNGPTTGGTNVTITGANFPDSASVITKVAPCATNNNYNSIAIDDNGQLYAWGWYYDGIKSNVPVNLNQMSYGDLTPSTKIIDIGARCGGMGGSYWALSDAGQVFVWGFLVMGIPGASPSDGPININQRGLGDIDISTHITKVGVRTAMPHTSIDSLFLIDDQGDLYLWGEAYDSSGNPVGYSDGFTNINAIAGGDIDQSVDIVEFAGYRGSPSYLALSDDGKVYAWGGYTYGFGFTCSDPGYTDKPSCEGNGGSWAADNEEILVPKSISAAAAGDIDEQTKIIQISMTWPDKAYALSDDGELFAWGREILGFGGGCYGPQYTTQLECEDAGSWYMDDKKNIVVPTSFNAAATGDITNSTFIDKIFVSENDQNETPVYFRDQNGQIYVLGYGGYNPTGLGDYCDGQTQFNNPNDCNNGGGWWESVPAIVPTNVNAAAVGDIDGNTDIVAVYLTQSVVYALDSNGQLYAWGGGSSSSDYASLGLGKICEDSNRLQLSYYDSASCAGAGGDWRQQSLAFAPVSLNQRAAGGIDANTIIEDFFIQPGTYSSMLMYAIDSQDNLYGWSGFGDAVIGNDLPSCSVEIEYLYEYECTDAGGIWTPNPDPYVPTDVSAYFNSNVTVTLDAGGTPVPCLDDITGSANITHFDSTHIYCTTTAHDEGLVDVLVSIGSNTVPFADGFEYIFTPYVALTIDSNNVVLTDGTDSGTKLTPTTTGQYGYAQNTVSVKTNMAGYDLSVSTNTTNNNLVHITLGTTIPSIAGAEALGNELPIGANTWGFSIDPGAVNNGNQAKWLTMPNSSSPLMIKSTTTPNETPQGDQTTINYGAKIDLLQASGTYRATVVYTAIGNMPQSYLSDVVSNNNITTMQNLTSTLCQSANYDDTDNGANDNNTVILTDTRNNQDYMVRKLADGNCWMINNLKISLVDVANNPSLSNPGINTAALAAHAVPDNSETDNIFDSPRYYEYSGSSSDINDDTFYGYYYNWCAAKGGTADSCKPSGTYPVANSADICPVGWRMPNGGQVGDPNNEFDQLNAKMAGYPDNQGQYQSDFDYSTTFSDNFQFTGPFRGVFAGLRDGSSWNGQSGGGLVWSGSFYPSYSGGAFNLYFDSSGVGPGNYGNRGNGFSVRCLLN